MKHDNNNTQDLLRTCAIFKINMTSAHTYCWDTFKHSYTEVSIIRRFLCRGVVGTAHIIQSAGVSCIALAKLNWEIYHTGEFVLVQCYWCCLHDTQ
jgi:hypothetical protein